MSIQRSLICNLLNTALCGSIWALVEALTTGGLQSRKQSRFGKTILNFPLVLFMQLFVFLVVQYLPQGTQRLHKGHKDDFAILLVLTKRQFVVS